MPHRWIIAGSRRARPLCAIREDRAKAWRLLRRHGRTSRARGDDVVAQQKLAIGDAARHVAVRPLPREKFRECHPPPIVRMFQSRSAAAWSRAAMTDTARMTALKPINADRLLIRYVAAVNRTGGRPTPR
jgi:hypothetical protein